VAIAVTAIFDQSVSVSFWQTSTDVVHAEAVQSSPSSIVVDGW